MPKVYEVIIENDQIAWLKEQPSIKSGRAIITFLEDSGVADRNSDSIMESLPSEDELPLSELGGSEPNAQNIPRRRYGHL